MEHIELEHPLRRLSLRIPPISISVNTLKIVQYTKKIAKEFNVIGLMNMQYAIAGDKVYVLEANLTSELFPWYQKSVISLWPGLQHK